MVRFAKLRGVNVVRLPSHHIARLDHRIPKRGIIARLDHHVANLPAHPTILTFEKRKADSLKVLTGRRGKVRHGKSGLAKVLENGA